MEEKKWYLTLNYQETKDIIRENLESMSRSFIAIGYYLRMIEGTEGYKEDGYKDIWEFAEDQYGIKRSTASRWMDINARFSEDGNSPVLADKYRQYGKSQLQELLYLPDEKIDEVTPDMTVKEIREIRKPEKKFQRPSGHQREYIELFAKHFISAEFEWLSQDHENRVSDVLESPNEIKGHLGMDHRTWYFSVSGKSAHINLFDEYVQVWDENGEHLGDFEWFYLVAEIQSMWNVVSLEKAQKKIEQEKIGYSEQCLECGLNKNGQAGILECHPEKGEHKCVTGDACDVAQDSEHLDETASCPPGQGGCPRMEWGTGPEQQKAGQQECKKCWADYKKYRKTPESTDTVLAQEEADTMLGGQQMRYTEYHAGQAVIKNKSLLPGAMAKLAAYEDLEEHTSGWIPVEERLPENGQEVLVTVGGYKNEENNKIPSFAASDFQVEGEWQNWNGVVAWMPLPEPYRIEN